MAENILIVEDEPTIACDIAMNLEDNGYAITAIVHNYDDAMNVLKNNKRIDLVMLDINLGGDKSGIDIAKKLDYDYGIPFIYLTSYADDDTINKAAHTFPSSYIVKPFKESDLAPAVRIALTRKRGDLIKRIPSKTVINNKIFDEISTGEYRVLEGVWTGKTNIEIGELLFISKNTVKSHIRNIYLKLDVHSKPEMVKFLRELK